MIDQKNFYTRTSTNYYGYNIEMPRKKIIIVKRKKTRATNINKNKNIINITNVVKTSSKTKSSKGKTKREKTRDTSLQPLVQSQPTFRFFNDIGNYTEEIERRNQAIQNQRRLQNDIEPQSSTRLGTPARPPSGQLSGSSSGQLLGSSSGQPSGSSSAVSSTPSKPKKRRTGDVEAPLKPTPQEDETKMDIEPKSKKRVYDDIFEDTTMEKRTPLAARRLKEKPYPALLRELVSLYDRQNERLGNYARDDDLRFSVKDFKDFISNNGNTILSTNKRINQYTYTSDTTRKAINILMSRGLNNSRNYG